MAWFRSYNQCPSCGEEWQDEWSCTATTTAPRAAHDIPLRDDLTETSEIYDNEVVPLRSHVTAEHTPDYVTVATFALSSRPKPT